MTSFAHALSQDEGFFDPGMNFPGVTSRLLHYPPQPVEGEVRDGLGAHTVGDRFLTLCLAAGPANGDRFT